MNFSLKSGFSPTFSELFTPKLITIFREGYTFQKFRADFVAGLTVAIVALPLSMAIAIASGATPVQGLYTAIFGGFIVSLLGGSRFQIGGPAGAFIVLVGTTVQAHGMDGLILATLMSGLMLGAVGFLRLGTYIKFIPYPVTVGFTAGIAVIIFVSQIKDLLGLTLTEAEPRPFLEKIPVLWAAIETVNPLTLAVSFTTIALIVILKKIRPNWPGMLIAVAGGAVVVASLELPLATIGSQFGGIPSDFPLPGLPEISVDKALAVLPSAVAFTLLGAIESLLSAVVADGMTGSRHRSNCELVAQGVANVGSALFGGICVTGTIARTATNVRAGAKGPISGILHAVFLLLFILIAAPLAGFIPLASLAGILAIVAWNMVEKHACAALLRASKGDALVLLSTFGLTVFRDLIEAIVVGLALGSVLFIQRMSKSTVIESDIPFVAEDKADVVRHDKKPVVAINDPDIVVYRITGAFFFGAAASIATVLDRIADSYKALIIDLRAVPFLDATAANTIEGIARKAASKGVRVYLSGASPEIRKYLEAHRITEPMVEYAADIQAATLSVRDKISKTQLGAGI